MSSTLMFRPDVEEGEDLPNELKYIIQKKYQLPYYLTSYDSEYLKGLKDAGVKGCESLIEMLEKYDRVKIWESY